jgi:hypothetical protein
LLGYKKATNYKKLTKLFEKRDSAIITKLCAYFILVLNKCFQNYRTHKNVPGIKYLFNFVCNICAKNVTVTNIYEPVCSKLVPGWMLEESWFNSSWRREVLLYPKKVDWLWKSPNSYLAGKEDFLCEVKRSMLETHHSSPFSVDGKKMYTYNSTFQYTFMTCIITAFTLTDICLVRLAK